MSVRDIQNLMHSTGKKRRGQTSALTVVPAGLCLSDRPDLMRIVSFLRHKHFFQLQVETLYTSSQPRGESVQGHERHRLQETHVKECLKFKAGLYSTGPAAQSGA